MVVLLFSELSACLRERVVPWFGLLIVILGALGWFAWRTAQVPDSPFTYQVM